MPIGKTHAAITFLLAIPAWIAGYSFIWRSVGDVFRARFGEYFLPFVFANLWFGAASHTFNDTAREFVKTGRIAKFL